MSFWNKISSIRLKMMLIFLPVILIGVITTSTLNFINTKEEITTQIHHRAEHELEQLVEKMEHDFTGHKRIAQALGTMMALQGNQLDKEEYKEVIKDMMSLDEHTFGLGIFLEPYKFAEGKKYFGPYYYKDQGNPVYTEEYEKSLYNYHNARWYKAGKESKEGIAWTDPYYDDTIKKMLITASIPIYQDKEFMGVATADYDLSSIQTMLSDVKFEKSGYALLVDREGFFIYHKNPEKIKKHRITEDTDLKPLGQSLLNTKEGSEFINIGGRRYQVFYRSISSTGWKLAIMAPTRELYSVIYGVIYSTVLITLVILVISVMIIYMFSRQITEGIEEIVHKIGFLAQGNLTHTIAIRSNDEVGRMGQHYNRAIMKLQSIVNMIQSNAENVAATAEELFASTDETCKSITEVASSIQMVATNNNEQNNYAERMHCATMDIHNQMKEISENIEAVKDAALYTSKLSHEGNKYVNQVVLQMNEINSQVTESSDTIHQLNEKSKRIEEIISMITNIAAQTNLLALNAAIEAARAGEHGKGFAVVADEVRKLAEASSRASGDINQLILEIQQGISKSVEVMSTSTASTRSGIHIVEQTGQAFKGISNSIDDMNLRTQGVYDSIKRILDETKQMREVVAAVNEIAVSNDENAQSVSAATQQQTAIIEQIASATGDLASMATVLQQEVQGFTV